MHVFISLLGGVPLCIPYGLYSGTSLGGTTRGTLEGYPGRVLSRWLPTSWFRAPGFKDFRHIPLGPCSGFKTKRCNFLFLFLFFSFFFFFF